eukprot:14261_1
MTKKKGKKRKKRTSKCTILFWISVACVSIYLLYVATGVPAQVNNHRLRYHPLEPFQIYELDIHIWNNKNIAQQGLSFITYDNQIPHDYQYELGIFIQDNNDSTALPWMNFTSLVEHQPASPLYIVLWSQTECNQSLDICFEDHYLSRNSTYYYTTITETQHFELDVQRVSKAFDKPRDGINFIVIAGCMAILILLLSSITESTDAGFVCVAILLLGVYYLYIFVLSVVPIGFCLLHDTSNDLDIDYWNEIQYSLTFAVGDYNAGWWVPGVILHGIWMYTLLLFLPAMCCVFMVLVACAECLFVRCCNSDTVDDVGLWILFAMVVMPMCVFFLMSIGYVVLFVGNVIMWNVQSYNGLDDALVVQCVVALVCIWIIFPIFGCIAMWNAKKAAKERSKRRPRPIRRNISCSNLGRYDIKRLSKKNGHHETNDQIDETETIAMTGADNKSQNVIPN